MGFGKFLKNLVVSTDPIPAKPATTAGQAPSTRQIYQSRLNRGPNLGSMFVLEKWISPHMFPEDGEGGDGGRTSELDAVAQAMKASKNDSKAVQNKFEAHWHEWITDDDWSWMKEMGVTSVRVPIGYWMVDNGSFCSNTPFEDYEKVYSNAWNIFKEVIIKKAESYHIGVLVDLHGLPGGANGADHSGTTEGEAKLWDSSKYQVKSYEVLEYLAKDLAQYDNVVGLQILNEAPYADASDDTQKTFYLKAMHQIREVNDEIPVVISDGWDLPKWISIVKDIEHQMSTERGENSSLGVMIDTHVYRCFSDDDKNKRPMEIVNAIENAVPSTEDTVDIMVGEFSCVLDGSSWDKHDNHQGSREDVVRQYGCRECAHFTQRTCGFYFWTYKFKYGGGGEWGFREMIEKHSLSTAYASFENRFPSSREPTDDYYQQAFDHRSNQAITNHSNYWQSQDPNRDWQHWRFADGFRQGWNDARAFDKFNHSEIGRKAAWKRSRELEHIREKGAGHDIIWVWRQAFDQGISAFLETRSYAFHG